MCICLAEAAETLESVIIETLLALYRSRPEARGAGVLNFLFISNESATCAQTFAVMTPGGGLLIVGLGDKLNPKIPEGARIFTTSKDDLAAL